jgi:hypothetical protein
MSDGKIQTGPPQPQGVGEDPLFHFTKVFVRFLQIIFSTFESGSFKWQPDLELTDIIIADQGQLARAVTEKRPAIICMRGPASWSNVAIDQLVKYDITTGTRSHTDLIASSMIYNCIGSEGLEAQRIAWISSYATRVLKRNLMRAGLHRVGENIEMGPEEDTGALNVDSDKESPLVRVSVPFFFQDSWTVAPVDKLLLNDLNFKLTSEVNYPAEGGTAIRDPALGGRILKYDKTLSLTQRVSVAAPKPPKTMK